MLRYEPDLVRGLDELEIREAELRCMAGTDVVDQQHWSTRQVPLRQDVLWLITQGNGMRRASHEGRRAIEILGPGDIVGPAILGDENDLHITYKTLGAVTVAILDRKFLQYAAHWPQVIVNMTEKAAERARELTALNALTHGLRLPQRLHLVLWRFANKWGRVTTSGIRLPFQINQRDLADIVGAQRPSVTTALSELKNKNLLQVDNEGRWIIAVPPESL